MAGKEDSRSIDQAAAAWTARLDRAPLTAPEEAALQGWLSADPRHKGALLRAQALALMSESARALGPHFDHRAYAAPKRRPALSRRQVLAWGGGAAAATGMAALFMAIPAAGATVRTGLGEMRLVPLEDGSTAQLNTDSAIRIDYDRGERRVALLGGEVFFSVVPDARRPFVVEVGGRRLHTVQAGFRVRKLARAAPEILVSQGTVDLAGAAPLGASDIVLRPNMRLTVAEGATGLFAPERPETLAPEKVARDLAWREGKLAFEGETLGQAAGAFARYSDTRIVVADRALAREPVTGLFSANDPAGFARAAAGIFGARLVERDHALVLSRAEPQ